MVEKDWNEWVKFIADQYDLDLKQTDKETEKQKRILEAALNVFAEKGFSGASTSEIAERAQVAEATIFKHYRTKKGLLLRLVIPAFAKVANPFIIEPALKILEQEKPLHEILEELTRDRMQLIEKNWNLFRIIVVESIFHPELREALKEHVAKNIYASAKKKIAKLKEKGKLRADVPDHVVFRSILSTIAGYIFARNVVPELLAQETEDKEIFMLVEVLMHGIAGKAEKSDRQVTGAERKRESAPGGIG
jgi:AcrR family transcriptional regulator